MVVEIFIGDCFKRDFKRLSKKYRSLIDDYEIFIDSLKRNPSQGVDLGNGIRKLRMCQQVNESTSQRVAVRMVFDNQ